MEPEWYVPGSMSQPVQEAPIADSTPSMIDMVKDQAETKFQQAKNTVADIQKNLSNKVPGTDELNAFDEQRIGQMAKQGISREKAVELIKEHG